MIQVRQLTEEQKNQLVGQVWGYFGQFFNPLLDADGNWFISEEEVQGCTLAQATTLGVDSWLLTLPQIPYNPIIIEMP